MQDDYRRTIAELDEKEFISLRLVIIEMRNHYVCYSPTTLSVLITLLGFEPVPENFSLGSWKVLDFLSVKEWELWANVKGHTVMMHLEAELRFQLDCTNSFLLHSTFHSAMELQAGHVTIVNNYGHTLMVGW